MKPSPFAVVAPLASFVAGLVITAGVATADFYEVRPFSSAELTVSRAYIAYYGRAADPGGLAYWSDRLEREGGNLSSIIQAFGESQEFNDRFGDLGTEALIRNLYQQLFNRDPDPGGLAYYSGELGAGRRTLQTIALDVLYGATGSDQSIIANKLAVSQYFTSAMATAPAGAMDQLNADAMAELVALVDENEDALSSLYCRARGIIYGEAPGALDGRSPAQAAFVTARGYPQIFSLSFTTEAIDNSGRRVRLDLPERRESWVYNRGTFAASWFENGFFVEETTYGFAVDMLSTSFRPDQFTLCMNEEDVIALMGPPSCEENYTMAGRNYRLLRFDPTVDRPPASVAFESGLLTAVTAGYALTDMRATSESLCN